jgi:hypothetical protein
VVLNEGLELREARAVVLAHPRRQRHRFLHVMSPSVRLQGYEDLRQVANPVAHVVIRPIKILFGQPRARSNQKTKLPSTTNPNP